MNHRPRWIALIALLALLVAAMGVFRPITTPTATAQDDADDEFVLGLIMVGPHDNQGWSQAHYEGALYVEEELENVTLIWEEDINAANVELTIDQVVTDMAAQGADMIIADSDEFKEDINLLAGIFPEIVFVHASGDAVLTGDAPSNVTNVMGQMEYGKMIAGCAAALNTESGNIGYLGPLINDETRRLVSSTYLGARYCYETYRELDPDDLTFTIEWIGFWFEIPGFTLNPTEVVNDFYDTGKDIVISGIDTTEAIRVTDDRRDEGFLVLPYDYIGACAIAPDVCLGVPYFNWGPAYLDLVQEVQAGDFEPEWAWLPPNWDRINDLDTSAIGFVFGEALTNEQIDTLRDFIEKLAAGVRNPEEGLVLWQGPLELQDGTLYLEEGEIATEEQIWYLPQLLAGMIGESFPPD